MSEKLLPCPFCGGTAVVSADMTACPMVACDACGAGVSGVGYNGAVAAWNRRAKPEVALERAVVEAAMALTQTAHDMGVIDPVSHIAVAMDLRKYAAKENAVFKACDALDMERKGDA